MAPSSAAHPPTDYARLPSGPASIPLAAEEPVDRQASVGSLIKQATEHMSTLVRSEIELAKLELGASIKQALRGSIFFAAAAAIGLFSLWFFWFMIGEIIGIWLPRWAAFTIVFFAMLIGAGGLAFLGVRRMRKIRKPERTISQAQQIASSLKQAASHSESTAS